MKKTDYRIREVAILLNDLERRKVFIQEITDVLKEHGHINSDIEEYERQQARRWVQKARKFQRKSDQPQLEMVHLFEITEDGSKQDYYKHIHEVSPDEGAQLLRYWANYIRYGRKEYSHYYQILNAVHGKKLRDLLDPEMIQNFLPFAEPVA
jgi:hypothetical protein